MPDFPQPHGVHTSVTYPELALLQRYAHGAGSALEIGTHYGFTCIGMALAGAHVTSVDPHYEGPADKPDTWEPFSRNVERHGFSPTGAIAWSRLDSTYRQWGREDGRPVLYAHRMTIEDWRESSMSAICDRFGLVFIDGNHAWPHPQHDIQVALRHLQLPGYVALHDVTPNWPGVWRAVREATESGALVELERVGTMGVYQARDYQK